MNNNNDNRIDELLTKIERLMIVLKDETKKQQDILKIY